MADNKDEINPEDFEPLFKQFSKTFSKNAVESIITGITSSSFEKCVPKHYKIPSVIRTARAKLKVTGIQSCIDFIYSILADNEKLQKEQAISLTKNLVKILKENDHESLNEFDKLVDTALKEYNVQEEPELYRFIADIYKEYTNQAAINYLNEKNLELLNNECHRSINFQLFIDKASLLIEQDELLLAKAELLKTAQIIENNSIFQFAFDKMSFAYTFAELCFKERNFFDYLKYKFVFFLLEITKDLSAFPILHSFHERKEQCYSRSEWGLCFDIIEALPIDKQISQSQFDMLIENVYNIAFDKLPSVIGFDTKHTIDATSFEEFRKSEGAEWSIKYKPITDGPFKHYDWIEQAIIEILEEFYLKNS